MSGPFGEWAAAYRERGFYPRPIELGSKACKIKGWQRPDEEIGKAELERWVAQYGQQGIGLLMGSPLPDGTTLGVLDVDDDRYIGIGKAVLNNAICGRIGKKGVAIFVRVKGAVKNDTFKVQQTGGSLPMQTADLLLNGKLCVIPPTVHPVTEQAYRWIDEPLLTFDALALPLIGE